MLPSGRPGLRPCQKRKELETKNRFRLRRVGSGCGLLQLSSSLVKPWAREQLRYDLVGRRLSSFCSCGGQPNIDGDAAGQVEKAVDLRPAVLHLERDSVIDPVAHPVRLEWAVCNRG